MTVILAGPRRNRSFPNDDDEFPGGTRESTAVRDCHSRSVKSMVSNPQLDGSPVAGATPRPYPHPPGAGPGLPRLRRLQAWFYVGVPTLLGFLLGWLQVGRAAGWPREVSLAYWIGVALLSTGLLALATAVVALGLRRVRAPLWVTLLAGQLVGGVLLVDPVLAAWRMLLRASLLPTLVESSTTGLGALLQRLPSNALLWLGLNLLFFHVLRMPRFGYPPPGSEAQAASPAGPATPPGAPAVPPPLEHGSPVGAMAEAGPGPAGMPPFMERVRPGRRGTVLALEADGHYLHVHTDAGSDMVLYRLSDAMRELGVDAGAQVHRSWWVAAGALSTERRRDSLRLVNGLEVPVSRSYRLAARERGWLAGNGES